MKMFLILMKIDYEPILVLGISWALYKKYIGLWLSCGCPGVPRRMQLRRGEVIEIEVMGVEGDKKLMPFFDERMSTDRQSTIGNRQEAMYIYIYILDVLD